MSKQSIKATIDANIKQNGVQAITGQIMNSVLNQMVDNLAEEASTTEKFNELESEVDTYSFVTISDDNKVYFGNLIKDVYVIGANNAEQIKVVYIGLNHGSFGGNGRLGLQIGYVKNGFYENTEKPTNFSAIASAWQPNTLYELTKRSGDLANEGVRLFVRTSENFSWKDDIILVHSEELIRINKSGKGEDLTPFLDIINTNLRDSNAALVNDMNILAKLDNGISIEADMVGYLDTSGKFEYAVGYNVTDYIPVVGGVTYTYKGGYVPGDLKAVWGYSTKSVDGAVPLLEFGVGEIFRTFEVPSNVKYIRAFSADGRGKANIAKYIKKEIIVGADGDYTNLSKAIEDGCKTPFTKIFVKKGTYDIIQEFKELYGNDFFDNFSNASQQGWVLSNKVHIVFEHGAKVICHYDGNNSNVKTLFSPINAYMGGFTIEGLDLSVKNCRYCSHDDRWDAADAYDNSYINCRFKMDNTGNDAWTSKQCIGGGMGQCGNILIDGCVFENASDNVADVSWHNTPSVNADNKIVVRNCYFNGYLYITSFGESENKMPVFVSNNSFALKVSVGMSPDATIVNVEVHEWNNYVRNSVRNS